MISFIIPTYNEEKVIAASLRRIRDRFTLVPFEIIMSDDKSSDATVARATGLADRIVLCHEGQRATIAETRNRGAEIAKYPYLVFLDADAMILDPNAFFARALQCFEADKRFVGLTARLAVIPTLATFADRVVFGLLNLWFILNNNLLRIGLAQGKFQMIRAFAFWQAAGYNIKLAAAEDADLFYRLSRIGRTRLEPSLTVFHRGRRGHAIGWPRLLWVWLMDTVYVVLFKRSYSKEWKPIR